MEYKNYLIDVKTGTALYTITRIGKGALPISLRGLYVSVRQAKESIDRAISKKETKGKNNAKIKSTPRS